MYCGKCGSQIPDDAAFCPVCGGKNTTAGAPTPQDGGHNPSGWNLNVQPDASPQQPVQRPVYQTQQETSHQYQQGSVYPPSQNSGYQNQPSVNIHSPVQTTDRGKNRTVLIIIISIVIVLLIIGIIATVMLISRMRDDDRSSETTTRTRQTTTQAALATSETTESENTEETTIEETEPTTTETAVEVTEPTDTSPLDDVVPGLVPEYIWEFADFNAELVDYAGHYQGSITTTHNDLDQIYIFQDEDRSESVDKIIEASRDTYFIDLFIEGEMLEGFSEHPLSAEDGSFIYFDPFEIQAGGYFEEYSNDNFDGTDVTMYGYVQTAFYQIPGGPPSFYLLNYEEYKYDGKTSYFEVRIDVELVD